MRISAENLRVYLSTPTFDDAQAISENLNNPEIALNSPGVASPYGIENARMFIELSRQEHIMGIGFHNCIRLLDGKIIGLCALANIDVAHRSAEIGYILGRGHWGNGYAKEAISLALGFGFEKLGLDSIYAKVPTYNERSIKLLGSIGFSNAGSLKEDIVQKRIEEFLFKMQRINYSSGIDVVIEGY